MRDFFRENPQVLVLLVITLVLGIGTFVAVLIGLISAGKPHLTGEPSGALELLRGAARLARGAA